MRVCMYVCMYVCMFVCMFACMYVCTYVCVMCTQRLWFLAAELCGVGLLLVHAAVCPIRYACNIGGMISPIASPQNVIAVIALATATKGDVTLSFASWLMVGIPFCAIATVTAFFTMQLFYGKGLPKQMPSTARMRRMSMASVISDSEHHILAGAGAHNPYENVMATPHPNKSAPPMDDDSEQELRTPTQAEAIRVRQGWDNEGYDAPSLEDQSSSPLLAPRRYEVCPWPLAHPDT